jgi:phosphatidylglycerol:prolipoprotein diacylglycerol transferase
MAAPEIWFPHLGIEIPQLSRVMFTVFGLDIYWYAVFVFLGVAAGTYTGLREIKRTGQDKGPYLDLLQISFVCGIIGARLYYVAFEWERFRHNPLLIITGFREGGLAIYGAIITAVAVSILFARVKKMNFFTIADTCSPSFIIGQAVGRWGNFINREAHGGYTDGPFAMRLLLNPLRDPANRPTGLTPEILANTVYERGAEYVQVHPTFLYESAWNFLVFALLTLYRPRKKFTGEVFWLYIAGYALGRFFIEQLRTDQLQIGSSGIAVSQWLSAVLFVASAAVIIVMRRRAVTVDAAASDTPEPSVPSDPAETEPSDTEGI